MGVWTVLRRMRNVGLEVSSRVAVASVLRTGSLSEPLGIIITDPSRLRYISVCSPSSIVGARELYHAQAIASMHILRTKVAAGNSIAEVFK